MVSRNSYGPIQDLKVLKAPIPPIGPRDLRIQVHRATVNRTDCAHISGRPLAVRLFTGIIKPRLKTPGTDFSGRVEAAGSHVKNFRVGDRVFGFNDDGLSSHAEFMVIRESSKIHPIPEGISYAHAAASIEGAHYALNCILKLPLTQDSRVLVLGGTGAIGSATIQLLRWKGVFTVASCQEAHRQKVTALGAQETLDYETESIANLTEKFDVVIDAVGKSCFKDCRPLLKKQGLYVSSELGPWGENLFKGILTQLKKGKRIVFPFPVNIPRSLKCISDLLEKGQFQPLIDRSYDLDQVTQAFEYVASGKKIGNVLLKIHP